MPKAEHRLHKGVCSGAAGRAVGRAATPPEIWAFIAYDESMDAAPPLVHEIGLIVHTDMNDVAAIRAVMNCLNPQLAPNFNSQATRLAD